MKEKLIMYEKSFPLLACCLLSDEMLSSMYENEQVYKVKQKMIRIIIIIIIIIIITIIIIIIIIIIIRGRVNK